jgi:hypothetical protein
MTGDPLLDGLRLAELSDPLSRSCRTKQPADSARPRPGCRHGGLTFFKPKGDVDRHTKCGRPTLTGLPHFVAYFGERDRRFRERDRFERAMLSCVEWIVGSRGLKVV